MLQNLFTQMLHQITQYVSHHNQKNIKIGPFQTRSLTPGKKILRG